MNFYLISSFWSTIAPLKTSYTCSIFEFFSSIPLAEVLQNIASPLCEKYIVFLYIAVVFCSFGPTDFGRRNYWRWKDF